MASQPPSRKPAPPTAKVAPQTLEQHGQQRVDDYYWLKRREDPEVLAYLHAENEYTEAMMAHTGELQATLFREIKARIKQDDASAPYRLDDYFYYERTEDGKEYAIHCRKRGTPDNDEEVILDVNRLAEGHEYTAVRGLSIDPGQTILAYAVDHQGRRIYDIRFKDLGNGAHLPDEISGVTGNMAWAEDGRTLFYARQDPETLRSDRIFKHVLGSDPAQDELVYEETDDTFQTYVFKTKSRRYVMIASTQTVATEYRYLAADDPAGEFRVILPRRRDHEYDVDHLGDEFYIRTNSAAQNFRLVKAPVSRPEEQNWTELIPHQQDVFFEGFELFEEFLVVVERRDGLIRMRIRPWSGESEHSIDFGEAAYTAYPTRNLNLDTPLLRYAYQSMTTPPSTFDYDMRTRRKVLIKQQEILGGFDSSRYRTERRMVTAGDGTEIPLSIVYRCDQRRHGGNPTLLYGYGSYGHTLDAAFSASRLSLLDRGFVWVIAHVRGGQELGRHWYEDGRQLKKKNTFTDFLDCAEFLIDQGYAPRDELFAMGGSAGGLLMGAVINMRPELFRGVVAEVPFVDVVTTMLDDSIPLTSGEYDEWGDPRRKEYYDYILSYSPYDNVEPRDYPSLLVTTGLHDSQVQYWEPAKWVAKLRSANTGDKPLLLKTEMEAGHGGVSGRYKLYKELAFRYAFLLDQAGIRR